MNRMEYETFIIAGANLGLSPLEYLSQIVHHSAALELELAATGGAQERRALILDLLIGICARSY